MPWLENRNALVTSSSRNLGAEVVRSLARRGARVAINYFSSEEAARALATELEEASGRSPVVLQGDTTTGEGTRDLLERALEELGGTVHVLVNNSGPFSMTPFAELPEEEWDRIWDANVKAAYLATQLCVPGMRRAGWGRIVNLSAGSAYLRNHSIYTLAKSATEVLTEELALELGPEITVNAVAPGQIAESAEDVAEFDPSFVERAIGQTPAGRLVTRREVAELIARLCEPSFDMVTGVTIPVDGGWRFNRF